MTPESLKACSSPQLFHGSPEKDLSNLRPGQDGKLYATGDRSLAAIFMLQKRTFLFGKIDGDWHVCVPDAGVAFGDNSGCLYKVPESGFGVSAGIEGLEWCNTLGVQVTSREIFPSVFAAFETLGVRLYTLSETQYEAVKHGQLNLARALRSPITRRLA